MIARSVSWAVGIGASLVAQEPTCRLEGRIVDPMARPIVGATVTAELDGAVLQRTHGDAEGYFVLTGVPWRPMTVRATGPSPEIGSAWLDLIGAPRHFVTVVAMPARVVRGVVRDDVGTAVPGAWVVAAPARCGQLATASSLVRADAQGAFSLSHVPFGECLLRAWAPGYDGCEGVVAGTGDVTMDCRVERDALQERIYLLEGGSPEARAGAILTVSVQHDGFPLPLPPELRRPSLRDGQWSVVGWPSADSMVASASLPGAALDPPSHATPERVGRRTRSFVVAEHGMLTGRIVGPDGPRSTWLAAESVNPQGPRNRVFGRSDADGMFVLPPPTTVGGNFEVRVLSGDIAIDRTHPRARGWFASEHDPFTTHSIGVHPAYSLRLRVCRDGLPVPGATATLVECDASGKVLWHGQAPVLASGTTGMDGNLEIVGVDLAPQERILCRIDSAVGWAELPIVVGDALTIDLGVVEPGDGADVLVSCTDGDRRPVPGMRVEVWHYPRLGKVIHFVTTADRSGSFLLAGMRAGRCIVKSLEAPDDNLVVELTPGARLEVEVRSSATK